MKPGLILAGVVFLLSTTGCGGDAGPVTTTTVGIDAGKAEIVRAEIRMGGGELHVDGGGSKLLEGSFRFSERVGKPGVQYDVTGDRGQLTIESPKTGTNLGKTVNEWNLRLGSAVPLEMNVKLGGGEAKLDFSKLPLQSVEAELGGGELDLNVSGKYPKDVPVQVNGGAGETRIRLPKEMGAVVSARVGFGNINASGLTKRDDKYYNAAYAEGKPAVRVDVRGGAGEITLSVGE
jgi:hypothetical protein